MKTATLHKAISAVCCCAALVWGASTPAAAMQLSPEMNAKISLSLIPSIQELVSNPAIIDSIRTQNKSHADLSLNQIELLDQKWRKQMRKLRRPMVENVLNRDTSSTLRNFIKSSDGHITDIVVVDHRGLNVCQSSPTTDYWQGDEAKFIDSFGAGPYSIAIGPLEFDDSTQTYLVEVSMTVTDPQTGSPIGAITVGVDVDSF